MSDAIRGYLFVAGNAARPTKIRETDGLCGLTVQPHFAKYISATKTTYSSCTEGNRLDQPC